MPVRECSERRKAAVILDLFCGCGGLSLGFRWAFEGEGWLCKIVGIDADRWAIATYHRNRVGEAVMADIHFLPLRFVPGKTFDVVMGGPPCPPYSRATGRHTAVCPVCNRAFRRVPKRCSACGVRFWPPHEFSLKHRRGFERIVAKAAMIHSSDRR